MGEWTGIVIVRNRNLSILTINNAWLRKQRVKTFCFFIWKQMNTMNEWECLQQQIRLSGGRP